ncbi:MAG: hypothetical protein RBR68_00235 [Tenuifilaceae bacterium]|nr:hypothetical protein [Tenuifilaceae bacterium]
MDVIGLGKKREYCFIERKFKLDSTERVKIFYDQFIYGLDENSGKVKNVKYSINNYQIRKLNYRNLKNDMIDIGISTNKLKKVNQLRIVQYISIGLGAALLTDVIIRNREPRDAEFMNAKSSLKLIASGLLFTFPLTLEKPKQDRLVKTLRDLD